MPRRIVIAGFAGAVVYFIWGMLAWMALPLHTPTINGLPAESTVNDALAVQNLETGVYIVPWTNDEEAWQDPESDFMKRHRKGPIYSIYYQKEGGEPMSNAVLLCGLLIDLFGSLLAACLLSATVDGCCKGYAARVGFVSGLGIFLAVMGHGAYWNWMHFPADYTIAFIVDNVIGWTLAGLVIAAIVKPMARPQQENVAET